jgi:hypothetical protein
MLPIIAAPVLTDIIIPITVAVVTTILKHKCKCDTKR